ncbi:hypothetical protein NEMBOFW57_002422 [Staphylotrichum longicolle]|uniref:Phospholipase/carboxylesterase/thioesterase domain-containing protein n=1 Tax=Staphylotrichum longicolle TaxID=669026 RepID=A0AAD4F646_9PEZI|nr:hypothetical protein NEMBOFW57_002422 [Staphylotrichum longicolle]
MLHGRGSNGPEFAEELAETAAPGQTPLTQRFPGWRWVFPSSQELWSTAFEEMLPSWFEAHSLTDTTAREDLQMEGIRQSVVYVQSLVNREVAALGASTWLPFAATIERLLGEGDDHNTAETASDGNPSDTFVADMMPTLSPLAASPKDRSLLSTPVFLGHGVDDAVVDVELGRQAKQVLASAGFQVEWKEYSGAELEGHWFKTPEQVEDMAAFMATVTSTLAETTN